jgi:hypothetical protein
MVTWQEVLFPDTASQYVKFVHETIFSICVLRLDPILKSMLVVTVLTLVLYLCVDSCVIPSCQLSPCVQ